MSNNIIIRSRGDRIEIRPGGIIDASLRLNLNRSNRRFHQALEDKVVASIRQAVRAAITEIRQDVRSTLDGKWVAIYPPSEAYYDAVSDAERDGEWEEAKDQWNGNAGQGKLTLKSGIGVTEAIYPESNLDDEAVIIRHTTGSGNTGDVPLPVNDPSAAYDALLDRGALDEEKIVEQVVGMSIGRILQMTVEEFVDGK